MPTHNVEYKYSYFENYGEIISFDDCDIKACYKCSYGCNKTGNGYVDGLYAVREKLGAFYKQMDEKMLQRYFFAKGPALNSVGAPLTGPGVITNILRQDALGCGCLVHDFCALNCAQKAAKIIDIMDDIECCQMDNSPNVRMIMNQIAYRNWKKLTREFNRLL